MRGHRRRVDALAVCGGSRLLSGVDDGSIGLWAPGDGGMAAREDAGGTQGRALGAGDAGGNGDEPGDKTVRVWDVGTGAAEATLRGGGVCSLAVLGDRLCSASRDGTSREWGPVTCAGLRTAAV